MSADEITFLCGVGLIALCCVVLLIADYTNPPIAWLRDDERKAIDQALITKYYAKSTVLPFRKGGKR